MSDRVAIVTGVGPGIGRSVALGLARDGCDVALAARTQSKLEEVAAEVEALGRRALVVPTDTGDVAQCRALVDRTVEELGRLDVLVSSAAGGTANHQIMNADLDDWQQAWRSTCSARSSSAAPRSRTSARWVVAPSSRCPRSRCAR
ncbi:MAG: SDR family NAD(P)-dependent oxidoreductase [Acidimicrobiia bacterium]